MEARGANITTSGTGPPAPAAGSANVPSAQPSAQTEDTPEEDAVDYPEYRRLVQDIPSIALYDSPEDELRHMPAGSKDSGWQNCFNSVQKYDAELCQSYREQIDTLLVFAGLFSAVVTAFAVESYQWLQDDPIDTSVQLLRDVVDLLAQTSNSTPPTVVDSKQRLSEAAIVRINSFWFLSLTLSLSAALVGILCKQWLREFERNVGQSPETALAVRYIRFQGFEHWKVGSIVASVPIIMQVALAFFMIGVIELLWNLHTIVACCVTGTAALTLAFYLTTTLLPVAQYAYICMRCCLKSFRNREYIRLHAFTEPQCAFKSAQAWLAFRLARPVINHLLKSYGYQFLSHYPPAFFERILRPADSWVDFDLNWVKFRENIHAGPRCAFECLTWIAANLGEVHMSTWIWHCVWARWLKDRDTDGVLRRATVEIKSVARSYPRIVGLDSNNAPDAQAQALIFQCSLRSDLPVNTALELLLRVAAEVGVNAQWTQQALHAISVVYRDSSIRLSDDIAIGLFRLAECQTHDIIFHAEGPNSATRLNGAFGFRDIAAILHRGTHLRDTFIPAMSGLVLQWLRSDPPAMVARVGREVFDDMIWYLITQGYRGAKVPDLRRHHGVMFIAQLAGAVAELWPDHVRGAYPNVPDARAILSELLDIFFNGAPELPQHDPGARDDIPRCSADHVDGERSNPPVPDGHVDPRADAHTELSDLSVQASEECQPPSQTHLRISIHVQEETDPGVPAGGVNSPSPPASPGIPASPPRSPDSFRSSALPSG